MSNNHETTQSLSHDEYELVFAEFTKRTSEHTAIIDWMKSNQVLLNLHEMRQVLSIGGGTGNLDMALYPFFGNVEKYTVIEPNKKHIDTFKQRAFGNSAFKFINADFSEAVIPGQQDLMLLSHCLYYMNKGMVFDAISKFSRSVLVFHNSEFGVDKIKKLFTPNNPYRYSSVDLEHDLNKRKFNFTKHRVDAYVNVVNPNSHLIDFLLEQKSTEKTQQEVKKYLLTQYPDGKMYHPVDVVKIDF